MPPIENELEEVGFVKSGTIVRSPKSDRRAWPSWSIRIFALVKVSRREGKAGEMESYPFQITVYHSLIVHICQPASDVFELLEKFVGGVCEQRQNRNLTSSNRSTSLWALMNSLMFPFSIHSDTSTNS